MTDDRGPMSVDRRTLARRLGWTALIAAVAATTTFVPPLVMSGTRPPAPQAVPPSRHATRSEPAPTPAATTKPTTTATTEATAEATPPAPSKRPATSAAVFTAVSLHAADPANIRKGARVIECGSCDGGRRVGYIGGPNTLAIQVPGIAAAGDRKLTVVYETEEPRTLMLAVNDGPVHTLTLAGAHDWLVPATVELTVFVPAGTSWIRCFNDTGSAPDINRIVLS
jgi:hypothetical protein